MTKKRRSHSGTFKAAVALEALRGIKTVNEIAAEHGAHPVQVSQWKKELQERSAEVFEKPRKADAQLEQQRAERLQRKVGELTMDVDFLKKNAWSCRFRWTTCHDRDRWKTQRATPV